jgi:RNA polymerase sigma-70 factor (ECF subfamily)
MDKVMELEDNVLVEQCLNGNLRKFRILVERYKKLTYYFALGMVGNSEDAYDLSQEAFVKAYRALPGFDKKYTFKSWLFTILSNLCKNALRSSAIRQKYMSSEKALANSSVVSITDPEKSYIRKQIKKAVWDALAILDEDDKEIIILKHFQDMSYKEISEVLNIPLGSVMSRLHYARVKLKKALGGILK